MLRVLLANGSLTLLVPNVVTYPNRGEYLLLYSPSARTPNRGANCG